MSVSIDVRTENGGKCIYQNDTLAHHNEDRKSPFLPISYYGDFTQQSG